MLNNIKIACSIVVFFLFIGAGIQSTIPAPDNARVYVNDSKKIYIGVPSIPSEIGLRKTTLAEARNLKYSPDETSKNNSDFFQEGRSLTGKFFERIGIFKPIQPRWNKDGSWNW